MLIIKCIFRIQTKLILNSKLDPYIELSKLLNLPRNSNCDTEDRTMSSIKFLIALYASIQLFEYGDGLFGCSADFDSLFNLL
jgi:hypothetical protein